MAAQQGCLRYIEQTRLGHQLAQTCWLLRMLRTFPGPIRRMIFESLDEIVEETRREGACTSVRPAWDHRRPYEITFIWSPDYYVSWEPTYVRITASYDSRDTEKCNNLVRLRDAYVNGTGVWRASRDIAGDPMPYPVIHKIWGDGVWP